jgi:hypothetical protein
MSQELTDLQYVRSCLDYAKMQTAVVLASRTEDNNNPKEVIDVAMEHVKELLSVITMFDQNAVYVVYTKETLQD